MSRYTGPTTRINRRFGQAIFAPTKAFERKPHPPGQHGPRLRRKFSEYAVGLNEKQKLRFMYGITEKQFRLTLLKRIRVSRLHPELDDMHLRLHAPVPWIDRLLSERYNLTLFRVPGHVERPKRRAVRLQRLRSLLRRGIKLHVPFN